MPVYLDHNATTPLDSRVLEAMLPFMQDFYGNASSIHRYGRLVRGAVDRARNQVAAAVGVQAQQVVFTSGGTEANNLALHGVIHTQSPGRIAMSAIEHPSLREPAFALTGKGWQVDELPVTTNGQLDVFAAINAIRPDTQWVSLMLANNETGALQPVKQLAEYCNDRVPVLHTDASQAFGKVPVDFADLGVQLMTLSAHKLQGPVGVGALIIGSEVDIHAVQLGGMHEHGLRAGSENVAAIVGFGMAAELANSELQQRTENMLQLREQLEAGLRQIAEIEIFAEKAERLPNTVQFGLPSYHGETLLLELDRHGYAVSSGSACHVGVDQPSHVLLAMGIEPELALSAVRVSIGTRTSEKDITGFLETLNTIAKQFRVAPVRAANV